VSPSSKLTDGQREFIRAHKAELLEALSAESRIRDWLTRILENAEEVIAEALEKCRTDSAAMAYYLRRATETEAKEPDVPESDVQRWAPGGEAYERIRSGWRLSRTPDGDYVWLEPGTWAVDDGRTAA
jgi:hypothetical protein